MDVFAIYGADGFGREIKNEFIQSYGMVSGNKFEVIFIDDFSEQKEINESRILRYDEAKSIDGIKICVALSNGYKRKEKIEKINNDNIELFSIISHSAIIGDNISIGESSVLTSNTVVTCDANIGVSCHLNIFSYIAHDCIVGDYVTFAPRVSLNGRIKVEDFCYIGAGATFLPGKSDKMLNIGEGSIIGAGAVVTKDVPPFMVMVGNPARVLKKVEK